MGLSTRQMNAIQEIEEIYALDSAGDPDYYANIAALNTALADGELDGSIPSLPTPTDNQLYILQASATTGALIMFKGIKDLEINNTSGDPVVTNGKFIAIGASGALDWA